MHLLSITISELSIHRLLSTNLQVRWQIFLRIFIIISSLSASASPFLGLPTFHHKFYLFELVPFLLENTSLHSILGFYSLLFFMNYLTNKFSSEICVNLPPLLFLYWAVLTNEHFIYDLNKEKTYTAVEWTGKHHHYIPQSIVHSHS